MTNTSHDHYKAAIALRDRIVTGQSNEPAIMAWAGVARQCAIASDKFRTENKGRVFGRWHNNQLNNIDRIWWVAKAQVETLARGA